MRIHLSSSQRIFLICFASAALFWLLAKLSDSYAITMPLSIRFKNLPRGLYINSENQVQIPARIRAEGYKLVFFNWFKRPSIEVDAQRAFKKNKAIYYWSPVWDKKAIDTLAYHYEVVSLYGDSLAYPIEETDQKCLPIRLPRPIQFAKGYDSIDGLHLWPDSVWVTAPDAILDTLQVIQTAPYQLKNVRRDVAVTLAVVNPNPARVRMNIQAVKLNLKVDRFTTESFSLPIANDSLGPGEKIKFFPARVKLRFSLPVGDYEKVQPADFEVVADTADLSRARPYLPLKLIALPPGIKNVEMTPGQVEYLIVEG
ncbi:MAG: hypothetical protein V6Z82_06680 [Flavobacteriales bacterium]